jgi:MoaA/NifB/PqqE/SkfB family radical SAM enzyme
MRNVWDEPLGRMTEATFAEILRGVQSFTPRPSLFFGGFGEPLAHPHLLPIISAARAAGVEVELITNGILLTETVARTLVEVGVRRLWVSIDGATPESYADVRLGDALPLVIENLTRLKALRARSESQGPNLGIAFVAMQRNIADLPEVIRLGKRLGADQFSVSNLLPHTAEMRAQILYARSLDGGHLHRSPGSPEVLLPRLDLDACTQGSLSAVFADHPQLPTARPPLRWGTNTCPFLEKGSISIRWDGAVSPCLPLLHTHDSYLGDTLRTTHAFAVGKINDRSLMEIWNDPAYARLRERLQVFDFSPCAFCNSCEMAEANLEDCFGNTQPACGGCLWAQGFIQCP